MADDDIYEQYYFDPRVFTDTSGFPPPEEIKIYDTTLRDGEQAPGLAFTPKQKVEIAEALSDVGVHIIDLGFPGVSGSEGEALQLILDAKKRGRLRKDLELLVMCRANQRDIDATIEALKAVGAGPEEITFLIFTSASDLHIKFKLGPMLLKYAGKPGQDFDTVPMQFYRETNIRMVEDAIRYAKSRGVAYIEFGTEDASRSDIEYLIKLIRAAVNAGADRYIFPDTTGSLTPDSTRFYVIRLKKALGKLPIVSHFHNDFDLATINTIVAMSLGVPAFSGTINGIGERAGNVAIHTVVVALKCLYGITIPGFKYEKLWELRDLVERVSGIPVKVNEPVVGINTFAHESGIHTHGVLAHPRTYEPIPYELVGGRRRLTFGKHTGSALVRWALENHRERLQKEGVEISDELVDQVVGRVKQIREQRAEQGITEEIITRYYAMLKQLELTEEDIVDIAMGLAKTGVSVS
ncbi:MAG: homocitrate synthase/isopropylmalate synthase family protein [bacterium JZ-2024 1]